MIRVLNEMLLAVTHLAEQAHNLRQNHAEGSPEWHQCSGALLAYGKVIDEVVRLSENP